MAIARSTEDAVVGDLLWLESDIWRKSEPSLVVVSKVARTYLSAGPAHWPNSHTEYRRDTGAQKMTGGYSASAYVRGWAQCEDRYWKGLASDMSRELASCRSVETLKTVAFALGKDGPPDFRTVPAPSTEDASHG